MSSVKWWRVVDPLNPLYGCDVTGYEAEAVFGADDALAVTALRKVDVLIGNRPFQLVAPDGDNLGIAVRRDQLDESPIQDDVVEIAYDLPHGKCLNEDVVYDGGDDELRIARYERAIQVAYGAPDGELLATCTLRGDDREARLQNLVRAYGDATCDFDDMVALMKRENH